MTEQPQPIADVSTVTPAQRAQILREESVWIEEDWLDGCFDGGVKDLMVALSTRIEDLEGATTASLW
ncbi:hypothetical protein [Actinoplanes subglobosus]|uniref:Uncharacterized protein n=1 Tax=Actinoplanes subglobosus TaxID=1547892 RepID=A0ABV8IGW4_9ACTN